MKSEEEKGMNVHILPQCTVLVGVKTNEDKNHQWIDHYRYGYGSWLHGKLFKAYYGPASSFSKGCK